MTRSCLGGPSPCPGPSTVEGDAGPEGRSGEDRQTRLFCSGPPPRHSAASASCRRCLPQDPWALQLAVGPIGTVTVWTSATLPTSAVHLPPPQPAPLPTAGRGGGVRSPSPLAARGPKPPSLLAPLGWGTQPGGWRGGNKPSPVCAIAGVLWSPVRARVQALALVWAVFWIIPRCCPTYLDPSDCLQLNTGKASFSFSSCLWRPHSPFP